MHTLSVTSRWSCGRVSGCRGERVIGCWGDRVMGYVMKGDKGDKGDKDVET